MKSLLLAWRKAVRALLAHSLHRFSGFFSAKPALLRGCVALVLHGLVAVPAAWFTSVVLAAAWAACLAMLFLGLGAERASTERGAVFALPPLASFAFWRWYALERRRYVATLAGLGLGLLCNLLWGLF